MKTNVKDVAVFGMLGALMYASKMLMELLPNIHLIGVFIVAITVVYRAKALYPLYIFVFLTGLFSGFATWWLPYSYIWLPLWFVIMLIPDKLSDKVKTILYMICCALHGLFYGTLYAPAQALLFGLDFEATVAWVIAGLPWDAVHAFSNLICGVLIFPLIKIIRKAEKLSFN